MPLTVFTAGHSSPQGVFYPDVTAPVVALPHRQAAELLRLLRVIDPHLVSDPGHAVVRPEHFAARLSDPIPMTFQNEADALRRLCELAAAHELCVGWDS